MKQTPIRLLWLLILTIGAISPAVGQTGTEYLVATITMGGRCNQPLVLPNGSYGLDYRLSMASPSMVFSLAGANGTRGQVVQCATIDPTFASYLTNGAEDYLFVSYNGQTSCGSLESFYGLGSPDLAGRQLTRVCLSAIDDGAVIPGGGGRAWRDVKFQIYAVDPGRPPVATSPPVGQGVPCHGTAYLDAFVEGSAPLQFIWLRDGIAVPDDSNHLGIGTSRLVIPRAALADTGWYTVEVSNAYGHIIMPIGRLQVTYLADFNASGSLSVQDMFEFLAAYFGGDVRADVNRSMGLTVQDIFDFLAAYFAGCP
jgi:hypothetical protein